MSASGVRAGQAYVEIATKQGLFDKGIASVQASMKRLASVASSIGNVTAGGFNAAKGAMSSFAGGILNLKGAIVGSLAVTGLTAWIKGFADAGSALDDMSQRTGMAASSLSGLGYAAKLAGSDLETVERSTRKMQIAIAEASNVAGKDARKKLNDLGTSYEQLASMSPEQQFLTISQKLSEIKDPAQQAAAAVDIFGKGGTALIPMLKNGSKGIEDMMNEAAQLGLVMSNEDASAAAELGDMFDILFASINSVRNTIGASLAPLLLTLGKRVIDIISTVREWIDANRETIQTVAQWIGIGAAVGAGLVAVAGAAAITAAVMTGLGAAAGIAGTIFSGLVAVVGAILSPIGLVIAGVIALGGALLYYTGAGGAMLEWMGSKFGELLDWVMPVISAIQKALMSGQFAAAGKVAMLALEIAFRTGTQTLYSVWTDALTLLLNAWTYFPSTIMNSIANAMVFIQNAFSSTVTWLTGLWDSTVTWLAKKLLYLYSLFDKSVQYEAAAKEMDRDYQQRATQRQKELDQVTNERNSALEKANGSRSSAADKIASERNQAAAERKSQFQDRIDELSSALKETMSEIDTNAEQQSLDMAKREKPKMPMLPELASVGQRADKTLGTFSGFTAEMIGSSTSSFDRLLGESKLQTELLSDIAGNTKDGGSGTVLES